MTENNIGPSSESSLLVSNEYCCAPNPHKDSRSTLSVTIDVGLQSKPICCDE